jgi:hypothetical protein
VAVIVTALGASLGCSDELTQQSSTGNGTPVRFRGDFETADPIQDQYGGAACDNTGKTDDSTWNFGSIFVVTDEVAKLGKAVRIDLPSDSTRKQACELYHYRSLGAGSGTTMDEWYALSLRIPDNYATAGWGLSFTQFNYEGVWGSPMSLLGVGPNSYHLPNSVRLVTQSGRCNPVGTPNPPGPGCDYNSGQGGNMPAMYAIPQSRFAPGTWNDLLVHVKWSAQNSGLYEVFHRRRGGTFVQTVNVRGAFPTVQWSPTSGPPDPSWQTIDKFGGYRGSNDVALSIYYDNICSGTSRVAVEACL